MNCKQIRYSNINISRNSVVGYFSIFRTLLKIAYQEKMLCENLNDL
ncbi:phage integrase SAM-like domain-containing protein [Bacteroides gallinaceum]|uniref:Phage integrase SAM-like domain-containing protein n=1 Tax=Bacteroides gallinaceum TaxID=1462571 RepID=A0ABT7VIH6_9BACE|nr:MULTISPECIES: phage integrase SAM-like domain-containing protein [Bacteroides]MDM8326097.1 phage integrase SAM-like domain-containing protein [Bacteroides gallinaceum]